MTLAIFADGVENPKNLALLERAAALVRATVVDRVEGRLIAIENAAGASEIYGRRPLQDRATIAVGNERRGLRERTLATADETLLIPTTSRAVTTLNVAAAAAVAAWYILRGSGPRATSTRPELRRPTLLLVGHDHVEVGSSLRSAAAFGFRDVLLDDRGAGWFEGSGAVRREARAAARRHKNPLFDDIVLVIPTGSAPPLQHERLARGPRQLVVVGSSLDELQGVAPDRYRVASLGLERVEDPALRLIASITLAEVARQVGRWRRLKGRRPSRLPRYRAALRLRELREARVVSAAELLAY